LETAFEYKLMPHQWDIMPKEAKEEAIAFTKARKKIEEWEYYDTKQKEKKNDRTT